ncbi:MAG: hypothetical protein J6X18_12595 [Bacteroidales bacterium]|nr:hypothetical protein [Bacteroidales bacterium]
MSINVNYKGRNLNRIRRSSRLHKQINVVEQPEVKVENAVENNNSTDGIEILETLNTPVEYIEDKPKKRNSKPKAKKTLEEFEEMEEADSSEN